MRIVEAEIYRNRRFMLGSIERLRYRPESPFQVIIGPNGAGKTTFLGNLLGYPQSGSSFMPNGFSRIRFETEYGMIDTIEHANGKYHFLLNDEPLNGGGTQTVQRELFAQYLKMTPDTIKVLDPRFRFTSLSPQRRQDLLTALSGTDMTYANTVYNNLRSKLRGTVESIKVLQDNIVKRRAQVMSDEELGTLNERMTEYNEQIRWLIQQVPEERKLNNSSANVLHDRYKTLLHRATKEWREFYPSKTIDAESFEDYEEIVKEAEYQLREATNRYESLVERHFELTDIHAALQRSDTKDIDGELARLKRELESYLPVSEEYMMEFSDIMLAHQQLPQMLSEYTELIIKLPNNENGARVMGELGPLNERLQRYNAGIYRLQERINEIDAELEKPVIDTDNVTCTHCGKTFNPKRGAHHRADLETQRNKFCTELAKGKREVEELQITLNEASDYWYIHSRILQLEVSYPALAPFFGRLYTESDLSSPYAIQVRLERLESTVGRLARIHEYKRDIAEYEQLKTRVAQTTEGDMASFNQRLIASEALVEEHHQLVHNQRRKVDDMRKRLEDMRTFSLYIRQLETEHQQLEVDMSDYINSQLQSIAREMLDDLQTKVAVMARQVTDAQTAKEIIRSNEEDITTLEAKRVMLERLVVEMSPKEGLIAEQMMGFVGKFIEEVNSVIQQIWSYPMEILPGKADGQKLTYYFPVWFPQHGTDDDAKPTDDIEQTSSGQNAIINYAFRITCLLYLGYSDGFLEVDEVEGPFTPEHKVSIMNHIRELVENGRFTQAFIISHHEDGWGSLPEYEVVDFDVQNPNPHYNTKTEFS